MAIYSLHHTAIGKSTQARPHTSAAHVRYISRPQAMRHFEAARCPTKPSAAMRYFRAQEDLDRANARVADKLMLALPRELNASERVALVRNFAEAATKGRAPWLAAFHDKGKDAGNPHCHLVIRDRDPDTGRRVIGTSEQGSTERFRQMWEKHTNQALKMAGRSERIDRRSLRARGIRRAPTIHEGPRAREMDARGAAAHSRRREARNAPGARSGARQVDYPKIDRGLSRPEYNRMIRARETETDFWNAIDRDQQQREFAALGHGVGSSALPNESPPLMKGIGRSPIHSPKSHEAVPAAGHLRPVAVPFRLPSSDTRFVARPASLEPSTEGVLLRQGDNEGSKIVAQDERSAQGRHFPENSKVKGKPAGSTSRGDSTGGRKTDHNGSMGRRSRTARGSTMSDEEDRLRQRHMDEQQRLKFQADQSRGRFDDLMKRSFLDPKAAERRMDAYRAKHGNDALYERLNHEELGSPYGRGMRFGRRPASLASSDYLKPGAKDLRTDSHNARRELPEATKRMIDDREKLRGANQTLQNAKPREPNRTKLAAREFPSVDERQAKQHRGLEQPGQPPAAKPRQAPKPDSPPMTPKQQQLYRYPKLLEHPSPTRNAPTMPVAPAKAAPPMTKPPMSAAPNPAAAKTAAPSLGKKKGMEM